MTPGRVMVFVLQGRGKPRVSTMHLDCDTAVVRAAHVAVGRADIVKEVEAWPSKLRTQFVAELKKRGLQVTVVDNRQGKTEGV